MPTFWSEGSSGFWIISGYLSLVGVVWWCPASSSLLEIACLSTRCSMHNWERLFGDFDSLPAKVATSVDFTNEGCVNLYAVVRWWCIMVCADQNADLSVVSHATVYPEFTGVSFKVPRLQLKTWCSNLCLSPLRTSSKVMIVTAAMMKSIGSRTASLPVVRAAFKAQSTTTGAAEGSPVLGSILDPRFPLI